MGKKADRQAARLATAQERQADELWRSQWVRAWTEIGEAVARRADVLPAKKYDQRNGRLQAHTPG